MGLLGSLNIIIQCNAIVQVKTFPLFHGKIIARFLNEISLFHRIENLP